MTIPSVIRVTSTQYYVAQTVVENALSIPETVEAWSWEGSGFGGRLLALIPDTENTNNLPPGVTRRLTRERLISFADIYDEVFAPHGIPQAIFTAVSITPGTHDGTPGGTPVLFFNLGAS